MVKKGRETTKQQQTKKTSISTELQKQLQRVKNWKAPGPDALQGYWIKTFAPCHEIIALQLQLCLEMNETPDW